MLNSADGKITAIRVPTKDGAVKAVVKCGNVRANYGLTFNISAEVKRAN